MTAEQLVACGFTNFVHSNSLVSKALAAVVEDPAVNMIYADFMSSLRNSFEFRRREMQGWHVAAILGAQTARSNAHIFEICAYRGGGTLR